MYTLILIYFNSKMYLPLFPPGGLAAMLAGSAMKPEWMIDQSVNVRFDFFFVCVCVKFYNMYLSPSVTLSFFPFCFVFSV